MEWSALYVLESNALAAVHFVRETLRVETQETLAEFTRLRSNVLSTFERMDEWLIAPPCSEPVIPAQNPIAVFPQWMTQEVVIAAPDGTWQYRSGDPGLYQFARAGLGTGFVPHNGAYLFMAYDPVGVHCVTSRASLA